MGKNLLSILLVMQIFFAWTQKLTRISGTVINAKTQKPLQNVIASIQCTNFSETTDSDGIFVFENKVAGNLILEIKSNGFTTQHFIITLEYGEILDLGILFLEKEFIAKQQLSLITLTENDLGEGNNGSENTVGLLQATTDIFNQIAAFSFGYTGFKIRGLDNTYGITLLNGIIMNKFYHGRPQWINWGASEPTNNSFGNLLGTRKINMRASLYRAGSRISFSRTNINYNGSIMATFASGITQKGWFFVFSASKKFAEEAYFEGSDYSANSFFTAIEKEINSNHSINITAIYNQNNSGRNSYNTEEVRNLAGEKYNSYWGWQNDKKRNSRNKDIIESIFIMNHYWKIKENSTLNTAAAYQFGSQANSRLTFSGATNPDPTNYRNLPSYYSTKHDVFGEYIGNSRENSLSASQAKEYFLNNKQINWNTIYRINQENQDYQSLTILSEDRTDDKIVTFNSIFNTQISIPITFNTGITFKTLKSENFQNVLDLLGGVYYKDSDPFLAGNLSESDLNNPNRNVYKGDHFGYNYNLYATNIDIFTQFQFVYDKLEFYTALNYSGTEYQREGLYKNGIYPTSSFGKSEKLNFYNYGFKAGITYQLKNSHLIDFNTLYMTKAPFLENIFPNARLNNDIIVNLKKELIIGFNGSYNIRSSKLKARFTGYFSKNKAITQANSFFAEGISILDEKGELVNTNGNAFVTEIIKSLDKTNMGIEFGLQYQITKKIKTTAAIAYGQYTYSSNPDVVVYVSNIQLINEFGKSTLKNYKQEGMPQQGYSIGLEYKNQKLWRIAANINYLVNNYLKISPLLRTNNFFRNPNDPQGFPSNNATEEKGRQLLKQEKFNPISLVNLVGGKSWRLKGRTIGFFVSLNNIFNISYKISGSEQERNANFIELSQDFSGSNRSFGPKYSYGYRRTYFINLYTNF